MRPKLVALDSSHLADLAHDYASSEPDRRGKAEVFQRRFDSSGCVLFICWHHLKELLSHNDDETVSARIEFIQSLPILAVVSSMTENDMLGMVIDLQSREVKAAFSDPSSDPVRVREEAAKDMIRLESGANIIRPFVEAWPVLKREFQRQGEREREIVAISRSDFTDIEDVRVMDMLNGQIRAPEDVERRMRDLRSNLSSDMRDRGDRRMANPEQRAAFFMKEVERRARPAADARQFGLAVLQAHGVDAIDIGLETTFRDLGRLAAFRNKLELLNRQLGLPWDSLKANVTEARLPSGIIHAAIERYRPDTSEWKGSDLGDIYLASLAAYADVTFVDKRTHEALRIGQRKSSALTSILRRVEKAGDYSAIPDLLGMQK